MRVLSGALWLIGPIYRQPHAQLYCKELSEAVYNALDAACQTPCRQAAGLLLDNVKYRLGTKRLDGESDLHLP
jgi:hypothetical protein